MPSSRFQYILGDDGILSTEDESVEEEKVDEKNQGDDDVGGCWSAGCEAARQRGKDTAKRRRRGSCLFLSLVLTCSPLSGSLFIKYED